jgi:hypothetical protein
MFCSNCGGKMSDEASFCPHCGKPLKQDNKPQNPPVGDSAQSVRPQNPYNPGGTPAANQQPAQQPYIPPQTGNAIPPAGFVPPASGNTPLASGYIPPIVKNVPPNTANTTPAAGYVPPQGPYTPPAAGYPPQNTGTAPQQGVYTPQNVGYPPRNTGFGLPPVQPYQPGAYQPPVPPKKKNWALIIAAIVLGLAIIIVPTVLLLNSLKGPNNNNNNGNNVILGNNGNDVSPDPAEEISSDVPIGTDGFRENYTTILGGGEDVYTVMVYMCGSDLESNAGNATLDLQEMLDADFGEHVNVVIQTGGCSDWYPDVISDGEVQRWYIQNGELYEVENLGQVNMLDAGTLADFIDFSASNFPANRYGLVFWDHGGGSVYGYGYDEMYPDAYMFLPDIASALSSSGVKFDMIGFDACLMGTLETAYMLEPYADYMIGSEETEPGYGWNYTPWLSALGQNTSIDTVELGAAIVDSFISQNTPDQTLSVVSLREIPYVYDVLCSYMENATEALANKEFTTISSAVAGTKAFCEGEYDLIDIVDFTNKSDIEGEQELVDAVSSAVKYLNKCTRRGVYGLSFYFPYTDLSVYGYAKEMFAEFGYGDTIYEFYDSFVNILADGQANSNGRSLKENFTGEDTETDYSEYDWYDDSTSDDYTYDNIDYTELEIFWDETNQYYYLPLTDEDWELITAVEMQILLDDGEGYIDLGSDQYFEMDDAGNLLLNYGADNTWVAIGGQVVCYYAEEIIETDNDNIFVGYVPAYLNDDTYVEIILEWDGADADGYIAGYRIPESTSSIGGAGTVGKGYFQFKEGDVIDYICDYYTYDGEYESSYYFGEQMVIGSELPAVTYEDVGADPVLECYMIVDIYQNYSWTESVEFS